MACEHCKGLERKHLCLCNAETKKVDGCNRCPNAAFKEVDHELLCKDCALSELIDVVERLTTAYVTVTAEVRYDHE
jgi:hypothetical protein